MGRFTSASNATLLCRLEGADDVAGDRVWIDDRAFDPAALCIYKPQRGEAPLWDFPAGTLYRREVAAYEVDRLLGWCLVPVTVDRDDGPFGRGAVQAYVAHEPEEHYFWMLEQDDRGLDAQLRRMVLFDLVIDNADRKAGHVLLDPEGRVRLVDHGVSFHRERKLRTVAWAFAGDPVPAADRQDVAALAERLRGDDVRLRPLRRLLSAAELDRLQVRCTEVASLERFPEPSGPRPFPWPLV